MTAVEEAIKEIEAVLNQMEPESEGLADLERLNLEPDSAVAVKEALTVYNERLDKLRAALTGCKELVADGYPNLGLLLVSQEVYDDLSNNAETIAAALQKFSPEVATDLGLGAGEPEDK